MKIGSIKSIYNIPRILFYILIIILIFSVLISFSGSINFNDSTYVIKVANSKVTEQQWRSIIERNELDKKNLSEYELKNKIYSLSNQLILKYVLFEEAKKIGIKVTDSIVKKEITKMPFFYKDGRFNYDMFDKTLKNYGISEDDFIEQIKVDLSIQKFYLDAFPNQNIVLPSILDNVMDKFLKIKEIKLFNIPFSAVYIKKATKKDLLAIYNEVQPMKSSQANISYAIIDPKIDLDKITSEENLRKEYEEAKQFLKVEEKRDISQIYFSSLKEANKAFEEIKSGVVFKAIAKKYSPKFKSFDMGEVTVTDLDKPIGKQIFKLQQGQCTEPIETPLGVFIFKVKKIIPARIKSYNELKEIIKTVVIKEEKDKRLSEYLSDIQFMQEQKTTFEEITKKYKLKVMHAAIIKDDDGAIVRGNIKASIFKDLVFVSDDTMALLSYGDKNYVLVKKDNVIPAKLKEFQHVQDKMQEIYMSKELSKQVKSIHFHIKGGQIDFDKIKSDKIFSSNKLFIKNLTIHGNKEIKKLPDGLVPILYSTKSKEFSPAFIDYKNKTISFLVIMHEIEPLQSEKIKLKGFYNKAIAEMESLDIQGVLKSSLVQKYKDQIDNRVAKLIDKN